MAKFKYLLKKIVTSKTGKKYTRYFYKKSAEQVRRKALGMSKVGYKATSSYNKPSLKGVPGTKKESERIQAILNKRKRLPISDPKRSMHHPSNVRLIQRMGANNKLLMSRKKY